MQVTGFCAYSILRGFINIFMYLSICNYSALIVRMLPYKLKLFWPFEFFEECLFKIYLTLKRGVSLHLRNLNSLKQNILSENFGYNMPSDSGEKVKKKMLKFTDRRRDRHMDAGHK